MLFNGVNVYLRHIVTNFPDPGSGRGGGVVLIKALLHSQGREVLTRKSVEQKNVEMLGCYRGGSLAYSLEETHEVGAFDQLSERVYVL